MANFAAPLLQAVTTTAYKSNGVLWVSATLRRVQLYELELGQSGGLSSTDCQCQWDVSRFTLTAILTATTVAASPLDMADSSVAVTLFANNVGTELTVAAAGSGLSIKNWGINQRGSYRWRALDDGDNIIIPATAQSGVAVRMLSSNFTGSAVGNISFLER